ADPRLPNQAGRYQQRDRLQAEVDTLRARADRAWSRLRTAEQSINRVKGVLDLAPEEISDTLSTQSKHLMDSISMLRELVRMPEDTKGIQRNPNNLGGVLGSASNYIRQIDGQPTQMATLALDRARRETEAFIDKVNAFLEEDLMPFKQQVEEARLSMFGELGPVD
ncbi:MAG: hypothetical protein AAFY36_19045, partial [Bacteroidota bacterium]